MGRGEERRGDFTNDVNDDKLTSEILFQTCQLSHRQGFEKELIFQLNEILYCSGPVHSGFSSPTLNILVVIKSDKVGLFVAVWPG